MLAAQRLSLAFMETRVAYIGVGSNLGDKRWFCLRGIEILGEMDGITVEQRSSLYRSRALKAEQDWYVNAVVRVRTRLTPRELLAALHVTELQLWRRREVHWGPRTIDLDLLLYEDEIIEESDLTLPHPQAHNRDFVLLPLSEIAPRFIHPVFKKSIPQLLRLLPGKLECAPLTFDATDFPQPSEPSHDFHYDLSKPNP